MAEEDAGRIYHHENLKHLRIRVELTDRLRRHKAELAVLAVSSKDSIRSGLRAVDASPFKTVRRRREDRQGPLLLAAQRGVRGEGEEGEAPGGTAAAAQPVL